MRTDGRHQGDDGGEIGELLGLKRQKLVAGRALTRQAEAANAEDAPHPQALPRELARRETLKAKLDAACAWLG